MDKALTKVSRLVELILAVVLVSARAAARASWWVVRLPYRAMLGVRNSMLRTTRRLRALPGKVTRQRVAVACMVVGVGAAVNGVRVLFGDGQAWIAAACLLIPLSLLLGWE